ncbi:helix-turn-helix domain-containing protein [Sphingomonas sp. PAMC26645]|uniref:transcriptional regulator n=1 Tax=Sphingomonas sp. PAMC26645 TaxID=2565555 RepID=UPI00109DE5A8|nr:YdaS family helix-turn-helix protein [Sphingomonas sp. PAMC26645]QCB42209.1 helix-turn-helix domain-containing protein [Sphingomonas sp. PAMC26645]
MGRLTSLQETDSSPIALAALREAVDAIGSQSATARLLEVTQGAVSKWLSGQRPLPAEHVLAVEAATGVSKHRLRPDIYPAVAESALSQLPANLEPTR